VAVRARRPTRGWVGGSDPRGCAIRRCTRRTTEASSATHIAPHVPAGLHSGHIEAPDIGIPSGMPISTTSTTGRTMTATLSTSMTVLPARSEREGHRNRDRASEQRRRVAASPAFPGGTRCCFRSCTSLRRLLHRWLLQIAVLWNAKPSCWSSHISSRSSRRHP
jgi:hypothetical protein